MLLFQATLLASALAVLPPEGQPGPGAPNAAPPKVVTVFRAAKVHVGDGRVIEDGLVLVEDGVVRRVGAGFELPKDARVVEHAGSLTPGLIALHSKDGAGSGLVDDTRAVMPEADLSYAFRPEHADFERSLAAGITSLVLSPGGATLVPGTTAVVHTSGGDVLKRKAHLVLGLSSRALRSNEWPTSYAAAMAELERRFQEPQGLFARAAKGELPVLMEVSSRDEIARALAFAKEHGLKGALYGSRWAEELVPHIQASGLAVVCEPADVGDSGRWLRSVVALAKAGVPIGFGLDAPDRDPCSLRFAAARAVRAGMDAEQALKALTGDAATIAGVADRVGRLEPGHAADLVLWSGDPLDLGSSVEAVYVAGARVHGGER